MASNPHNNNISKVPPYCSIRGGRICLRKYANASGNTNSKQRNVAWSWETKDATEESLKEAWKAVSLVQDLQHYNHYLHVNKKYYDPNTYEHLSLEFMQHFAENQTHIRNEHHLQQIQKQMRALRRQHTASTRCCVDTGLLMRDLNPHKFLQARKATIKRTADKIRILQHARDAIHSTMFRNNHGHFAFTGSLTEISEAETKINCLLQKPSAAPIYIGRQKALSNDALRIVKCGRNYRVSGMTDHYKLIAATTIPPRTIIGLYNFMALPYDDFSKLHVHPLVHREHAAYALQLTVEETPVEAWLELAVCNFAFSILNLT